VIRDATLEDLDALIELEKRSFSGDRISRRSFRRFLKQGRAAILVETCDRAVRGYVLLLFREGSKQARLYSIAVSPEARGQGVGLALLRQAEEAVLARGRRKLRLEIHRDNRASKGLFGEHGYTQVGEIEDYYHDGATALLFEKDLERS
jgi:ribosomal protein S18 acetylase RimI-like enzyme